MRRVHSHLKACVALLSVAGLLQCRDVGSPESNGVASVRVTPSSANLAVGGQVQLAVTMADATGNPLFGRAAAWTTSADDIATVSAAGLVQGIGIGSATVTATSEGKTGTAAITVTPGPLALVTVAPDRATLLVGQNLQLVATSRDSAGNVLSGRRVAWTTSAPAIARVDTGGVVQAVAAGSATIVATTEGKTGSAIITVNLVPVASVTVTPPSATLGAGFSVQLAATLLDSIGQPLSGRAVAWTTDAAAVATVDSVGRVTAHAAGGATISATSEGQVGTSGITVSPDSVASVTIDPPVDTLLVTQTIQLTAVPRDSTGKVLGNRTVVWTTNAPEVAEVTPAGLVTATGLGTAVITATSEGTAGTATITVRPVPVASVTVAPDSSTLFLGDTLRLAATMRDSAGAVLTGRAVVWGTNAPNVATVSATGLVTARAVGSATITATSEGKSGTAAITVTLVPVAFVTVSPDTAAIVVGATIQLAAVPRDAQGNALSGRPMTWSTDAPGVATVSATGLVAGVAAGSATISATSEEKTGTAAITVVFVPVASVTVTPDSARVLVGQTVRLTATPRDSLGNVLTGRVVVWASSAPGVATVDSSGLVRGAGAGTATITGTIEGKQDSATIAVNLVPVAGVTMTPGLSTLTAGQTTQLAATVRDSVGNTLGGRTIVWGTDAPGVVSVGPSGLVEAVGAGSATVTATSEGVVGVAMVTVRAAIATAALLQVDGANARYFTDGSGRPILLTGSHTWANLQDLGVGNPPPVFDYTHFLDVLQANNHNFFRLWAWEQGRWMGSETSDDFWLAPSPFQRPGPSTAADGLPKYDVTLFNQAYFDRLRARVIAAGDKGLYVSVMLFNGFSVTHVAQNNPWKGHPFKASNNINGINGDPNGNGTGEETHTLEVPAVTAIQDAYVKKVVDAVNDLDNVLYEISNESPSQSQDWQYHMIQLIKDYEATKPKQHPVGMTVEYPGGDNAELFASAADWISPNGDINTPPPADGSKVILSDTDHLCGVCGSRAWVWKSFLRGQNPIFMDPWNFVAGILFNDPTSVSIRQNLGYVRAYAARVDLAAMTPQSGLASTGYCLAHPAGAAPEYLVYLPSGGQALVDLSATSGVLQIEWFNLAANQLTAGGTISAGGVITVAAPFTGDAVLYLHR